MGLIPSTMMPLGTPAPDFHLLDVVSNTLCERDRLLTHHRGLVVMFICNHCPYVKHIINVLVKIAADYQKKGINFIAINSNDPGIKAADSPENMRLLAIEKHFSFPYVFDETQAIAKAYDAVCTPDFFLFDAKGLCVYRGRFDASRVSQEISATGIDLTQAMDALLQGNAVPEDHQHASIGCSIKWRETTGSRA